MKKPLPLPVGVHRFASDSNTRTVRLKTFSRKTMVAMVYFFEYFTESISMSRDMFYMFVLCTDVARLKSLRCSEEGAPVVLHYVNCGSSTWQKGSLLRQQLCTDTETMRL